MLIFIAFFLLNTINALTSYNLTIINNLLIIFLF